MKEGVRKMRFENERRKNRLTVPEKGKCHTEVNPSVQDFIICAHFPKDLFNLSGLSPSLQIDLSGTKPSRKVAN